MSTYHLAPYPSSKIDIRLENSLEWLVKDANFTAELGLGYLVDSSTGSVTVNIPTTAPIGRKIGITDAYQKADTNEITINPQNGAIDGSSDNFLLSQYNADAVILIYVGGDTGWKTITSEGINEHGELEGLASDDHTQYHNNTRGDIRYLYKENTTEYTPTNNYHPATKKYVDDRLVINEIDNTEIDLKPNIEVDNTDATNPRLKVDALKVKLEVSDGKLKLVTGTRGADDHHDYGCPPA